MIDRGQAGYIKPQNYEKSKTRRSESGFEAAITVYECQACGTCPQKHLCTRAKGNRRISVSKDFIDLRSDSRERITSEYGKMLWLNRFHQSGGRIRGVEAGLRF